jgi:uncharacterized membrane protein YqiK
MNEIALSEGLKKEVATLEEMTRTVAVRNPEERTAVYQLVQSVKTKKRMIVDFFADSKEKAHVAWKAIVGMEKNETDKLDAFEAAGKKAILVYDQAEEAKRIADQRRLQAIADEQARKEREKAEAEARRQREIEEAARRKAEDARRAAEAANAAERAKLLREAEAADRKAAAANAKAENQAETATAVVAPVVTVATVAVKQAGESTKTTWKGRVIDINQIPREYLVVFIKNIPSDKFEAAVNQFARSTKGNIPVAGIQFYEDKSLSIRS